VAAVDYNPSDVPPFRRIQLGPMAGPVPDRPYHPNYTNAVFPAGTILAPAASPIWGIIVFGRFSFLLA